MTSPAAHFALAQVARDQGEQGEGAAFALVVGAHRDQHIFGRDDQHQRPEDQAEHAEDVQPVDRQRVRPDEASPSSRRAVRCRYRRRRRRSRRASARAALCFGSAAGALAAAGGDARVAMRRDVGAGGIKIPCGLRGWASRRARSVGPFDAHGRPLLQARNAAAQLRGYAEASFMVAGSTLAGLALAPSWGNSAVDLLYLPAVLGAAMRRGARAGLVRGAGLRPGL